MVNHAILRHRQAARALVRRNPTHVQVLAERFSPTAVFPGMEEDPDPFFFGGDDDTTTRRGRHTKTQGLPTIPIPVTPIPIITPEILPPPISAPVPTTSVVVPPIISPPVLPSSSSSVVSTTSVARTTTPLVASVLPTTASPTFLPAAAVTSASSQPSQSSEPTTGISAGAVIGGVGAGILALAAIGFAVAFFIRRTRKRDRDGPGGFDVADFRRSALVLHDPPTHEDTVARGYNPPPSGMEQRQQTPASAPAWGHAESHYGAYNHYGGQPYPSFAPGQLLNSTSPPPTAISAQSPFTPSVTYPRQNPISPISPMPSSYDQEREGTLAYPGTSEVPHQAPIAPYPTLTRQLTTGGTEVPADDYVDLNRSSVSPFQAAQYAEISRRLNAEVPSDKSSPAQLYATQQKDLPPVPPPRSNYQAPSTTVSGSPFADPEVPQPPAPAQLAPTSPTITSAPSAATPPTPSATLTVQTLHVPAFSTDSLAQEELQFPVPPSPVMSSSSRYRVDSLPFTLPEIKVQERSSVSSYIPKSPLGSGFPSGISGVSGIGMQVRSDQSFVNTPSPLASSFGVVTPVVENSRFAAAQEQGLKERSTLQSTTSATHVSTPAVGSKDNKDSKRPDTVYDPEDVYGGI